MSKRRALPTPRKPVKSRRAKADDHTGTMLRGAGFTELRRLIRLVQQTGIGELEVSGEGRTVRILAVGSAVAPLALPAVAVSSPSANVDASPERDYIAVTCPMVGTFYRSPAPDADPYVEVGSVVEVGQTVCIVEAMKLMNEIEAESRGRIVRILVENSQPVEYGQKLFLLEPL